MYDEEALVTYDGLSKEYGITYSRTHLPRLEKAEKFPKRLKPLRTRGSRIFWRRGEIRDWLKSQRT
jgi:predicted DNA-binding transcriptional regulator AlpA